MSLPDYQPMRCALVGADSLLIECGNLLREKGHEVVVVGAGSARVAAWAAGNGIPTVDVTRPAAAWEAELAAHEIDWLFAVTHLALLPDSVIAIPAKGAVNFHDGPLPAYGGLNAPVWALLDGASEYGVTWHAITSGIDEGDILKERRFEVAPGETSLSLNTRNLEAAIETFDELVDELAAGTHTATPQDPTRPRSTFSRYDRPADLCILDWRQPADELDRLVRALTFGPYPNPIGVAKVQVDGRALAVVGVEVRDDAGAPGTVLAIDDDAIVVACGEGSLALTGLATLRGEAVAVDAAATLLDIAVDSRLPVLDEQTQASYEQLGARLAREERHHLAQLATLEPVEVPWAATPPAAHVAEHATIEIGVPSHLQQDPAAIVSAFGVVLARVADKRRFHLALVDGRWADATSDARAYLAPAVPFEVAIDEHADMAATTAALGAELSAARGRLPFLHELIAREPELGRRPELVAGRLLPIAVRLDDDGAPGDGVVVELVGNGGSWALRYDDRLVTHDDARLLGACVEAVLAATVADQATPVAEVDLLGPALRERVLHAWNDTSRPIPDGVGIHHLVEQRADLSPDVTAVVFEDERITYRELDERANRLAHLLIGHGVQPDGLVGVHVSRGIDLVVAVLAVLKAGGAYVPLDPVYPANRLDHMISDSGCRVVLTQVDLLPSLPRRDDPSITVVALDAETAAIQQQPATRPAVAVRPDHLAYCIYTSGSTGLPKGVLIEHRNAVNFFEGMDDRVPHELPATWFAVTSLSFDISVLELLYTLTRGFTVVVYLDRDRVSGEDQAAAPALVEEHAELPMDFSLFYFSGDSAQGVGRDKYRLLMEGARFADEHGFSAVWTPERHFHAFGGLYPQPAVTSAAVAAITSNIAIRAGSVVMPLEHPIRVAEAWSVVDNISNGRVGISFAAGWQPNDFVLRPENYANAKQAMFDGISVVQRLWKGETVAFDGPKGDPVEVATLPRPVQPELPVWVTTAGNPETYIQAGRIGANVLTHLLGQSVEQLAPKIEAYRAARAEAGFDPDAGVVTLMLHTYVGEDEDAVRDAVREPLKAYLGESFSLLREYAWSFPAFQRPAGSTPADGGLSDDDFANLDEEDLDAVLEFAFLRYYESSGLFGTPDRCRAMVDRLKGIGVDEVACLIDFGIETDDVLASLPLLDSIRQACNRGGDAAGASVAGAGAALDQSVAAQLERHRVTHLQCTPSMARMWSLQDDTRSALAGVDHLFIGGEAFPVALAKDLRELSRSGNVTNMYGPTETTIWSTTWKLEGDLDLIPIGTPIANTQIYILDRNRQPVPPGVAGELWIGGHGVVRGYHQRPELTAERFVPDPFVGGDARMYLTGDLARWRQLPDGSAHVEFLGRIDHQVKIRGYRIELGEIEAQLGRFSGVRECVAVVREDVPGDQQLMAYLSVSDGATVDPDAVKEHLRATLPEVMVPAHVTVLADLPHTPNGKIDRNGLPSLAEVLGRRQAAAAPTAAGTDLERSVLDVWKETLGTDGIGIDDNFFDIGGHSLLMVRMHRRLKERLDRPITLTELYRHPTVRSFAASLSQDTAAATQQSSRDRAARRRESLQRRRVRG